MDSRIKRIDTPRGRCTGPLLISDNTNAWYITWRMYDENHFVYFHLACNAPTFDF